MQYFFWQNVGIIAQFWLQMTIFAQRRGGKMLGTKCNNNSHIDDWELYNFPTIAESEEVILQELRKLGWSRSMEVEINRKRLSVTD